MSWDLMWPILGLFGKVVVGIFVGLTLAYVQHIVKKCEEIRSDIFLSEQRLFTHFSQISEHLNQMEIRISNQMNVRLYKLEEREQELRERTLMLEFKREEEIPRKRGRPPKQS